MVSCAPNLAFDTIGTRRLACMRHIIVGTAGHIDHGKTSLVRALTGVDTDRLEEEKRRGISIDLGFAHLDLGSTRIAFIDVPGHERFVKNMLAGTGGVDLVLLVIAADESIKPQTREHFDICRLLRIPRGIIVLTKADLVDEDILGLVRLEAEEFVRSSFLEGAPVVAVSATARAGLDELKQTIITMAASVQEKSASRHFRLPIDRSFSMRGFGTVVTGTLISGNVKLEDEIEVLPGAARARVRGIQTHGRAVDSAQAGERTALNIAGLEPGDLRRGLSLVRPGLFEAVTTIDTTFELLPSAQPLKHRAPVHFHAGTAEVEAEARIIAPVGLTANSIAARVQPGETAFVRFVLREPHLLLPGDRFIVRMFSPVVTIGGGNVLDVRPPRKTSVDRCRTLTPQSTAIPLYVAESAHGLTMPQLIARTGLCEAEIRKEIVAPLTQLAGFVVAASFVRKLADRVAAALKAFHAKNPLVAGLAKEDIRSREEIPAALFDAILARTPAITNEGELLRLSSHKVALKQDETDATARIEQLFFEAGLAVPALTEVLAKSGVDPTRARNLLQLLLKSGKLIRVGADLVYHTNAITDLRAALVRRKGQRFSVPEFKDWTGVSRKYAIPLLEFLDQQRVTRREGDARVIL